MLPRNVTKKSTVTLIVIAALVLFVAVSALPRYASSWPWSSPLKVANQSALQAIRDEGISLPGWLPDEQAKTKIGGDTWSIQQLSAADEGAFAAATPSTIFLLLRPQVWEADQPEVEWLDLRGAQQWDTDSRQALSFEVPVSKVSVNSLTNASSESETIRINTDFFRAWSKEQTYAVLQWYACPTGGSPSPAWWFWADQKTQWQHRQRMPWVAVSLWLPIEPLSNIDPYEAIATDLGKAVHQELLQTVFSGVFSENAAGDEAQYRTVATPQLTTPQMTS
ncbi:MAG: cyanoexosortase B system-associated protein [Phormidesmis sp.]